MIAIVDYGVGNLFSLKSSLAAIGAEVVVTKDAALLRSAHKLILPGVGAFEDAARKLRECGLDTVIKEEAARGKPILGICLGMQLLFEKKLRIRRTPGAGPDPRQRGSHGGLYPGSAENPPHRLECPAHEKAQSPVPLHFGR